MPSVPATIRLAVLAATFIALQSPARAGEDPAPDSKDAVTQTAALAAPHSLTSNLRDPSPPTPAAEIEIVTGDGGQQGPVFVKRTDCTDGNAVCAP